MSGEVIPVPTLSAGDSIQPLCAEIVRLCDSLRGERAYLALCTIYPAPDPRSAQWVREAQLREQNCLYLLRQKRAELVTQLNSIIE